jgi:hypothetical protein
MQLTPMQASKKIREHLNEGNGIYIDGRYFDVRVHGGVMYLGRRHGGVLQVWANDFWFDVKPGSEFRNSHGRTLFVYEPIEK